MKNVLVTNGCAELSVLEELLSYVDAMNIDLKGFSQDFYDLVGGEYLTIRRTIERLAAAPSCHLEVTTLVVPGMNDTEEEIDAMARWLASLDEGRGRDGVTYHVTRFFPRWRLTDRGPTPVDAVYRLADVARRHLEHVYTGNC